MKSKPQNILLVDDKISDNFLSSRALKKYIPGCSVTVHQGGQEALDYLNDEAQASGQYPDLIFLDINMPRVDGWEFLRQYERLPEQLRRQTVVCMLSTSDEEEDRNKALSFASVQGFCTKPLSLEGLRGVMNIYRKTIRQRQEG